jgi:hypothetical protein
LWAWLDLNQRPHPYQQSRAYRYATLRFCWSLPTVEGEERRSYISARTSARTRSDDHSQGMPATRRRQGDGAAGWARQPHRAWTLSVVRSPARFGPGGWYAWRPIQPAKPPPPASRPAWRARRRASLAARSAGQAAPGSGPGRPVGWGCRWRAAPVMPAHHDGTPPRPRPGCCRPGRLAHRHGTVRQRRRAGRGRWRSGRPYQWIAQGCVSPVRRVLSVRGGRFATDCPGAGNRKLNHALHLQRFALPVTAPSRHMPPGGVWPKLGWWPLR